MTVGELAGRMSHREFREWAAEYRIRAEEREEREMEREASSGAASRARNPQRRR